MRTGERKRVFLCVVAVASGGLYSLQQSQEFRLSEPRVLDDAGERPSLHLSPVYRNRHEAAVRMSKHQMRAALSIRYKPRAFERSDYFSRPEGRQPTHAETGVWISIRVTSAADAGDSTGIGLPWSAQ